MILMAGLSGCVGIPHEFSRQEFLSALCQQANIRFSYDPIVRSVRLTKNNKQAYVLVGSDAVTIGADKILLSTPVSAQGVEIYVPQDFRQKVVCRLDPQKCQQEIRRDKLLIVIDPGHGGKDPGATGLYQLKEKDIVLDIARRLGRLLEYSGYGVRLTRTSDKFISLEQRTEYAAEWGADLYISIHANSSKSARASGFEVWAPRSLNPEDIAEAQRKKNHQLFFKQLNMKQYNDGLDAALEDMLYRYKYYESLRFASTVSHQWARKVAAKNRGIKQSGFFVLRNTLIPSVLVEVGFLSNKNEARLLKDPSYRQDLAEVLAQGLRDYMAE